MWSQVISAVFGALIIYVAYLYYRLQRNLALIRQSAPGLAVFTSFYQISGPLEAVFIPDFLLAHPKNWIYSKVYPAVYDSLPKESNRTFMVVSPSGFQLHTSNADIIKEVTGNHTAFIKPVSQYGAINIFGDNIVGTEHAEWKRHRKVASPQFNEKNNALVHASTLTTADAMFNSWASKDVNGKVRVSVVKDMQLFSLSVFSESAFGKKIDFSVADETLGGPDAIDFRSAIMTVATNMIVFVALPSWLLNFKYAPRKLKRMNDGMLAFKRYVQNLIDDAASAALDKTKKAHENLLSRFVAASILNPDKHEAGFVDEYLSEAEMSRISPLTKEELLGDVWILLFAGYETTAATLAHAFIVTTQYPEIQERLYEESVRVYGGKSGHPTFGQLSSLHYANAVIHETLRVWGPVASVPKKTARENTALNGTKWHLPKDTYINVHMLASHHNPDNFPEPGRFLPERFLREDGSFNPRLPKGWIPFSDGARSCIGKQFAKVEMIFLMSYVASRYSWMADVSEKELERVLVGEVKQELTHKMKYPIEVTFVER